MFFPGFVALCFTVGGWPQLSYARLQLKSDKTRNGERTPNEIFFSNIPTILVNWADWPNKL